VHIVRNSTTHLPALSFICVQNVCMRQFQIYRFTCENKNTLANKMNIRHKCNRQTGHEPNPTGKKDKVNSWGRRLDNRIHKGAHAGTRGRGKDLTVNRVTCARLLGTCNNQPYNAGWGVGLSQLVGMVSSAISLTILYQTITPYHETLS